MTFSEYQQQAKNFAFYPNIGDNLGYAALGLAGEAGEVANDVKKHYRDDNGFLTPQRKENIQNELGDVLWYCAMVAEEAGLSLEGIAEGNIVKLLARRKASGRG